ncbi:MAG TPA: DUF1592 domain-containing protein [Verrucomicrobiota bacterium]|nr:DUF1592 domain-containing protein [Verrucomicrobiota bacterium]
MDPGTARQLHRPAVRRVSRWAVAGLAACALQAAAEEPVLGAYDTVLKPLLKEYCYSCHGPTRPRAEINLEQFQAAPRFIETRDLWEKVRDQIESREMPPENKPQPSEADRTRMIEFIDAELARFDCTEDANPGKVTIRRLNRAEYQNTIRDLLGIWYDTHENFPADEVGYGFDNIGDVLSLPPMLMEKYLAAAEEIAEQAITTGAPGRHRARRLPPGAFVTHSDAISLADDGVWGLFREGEVYTEQDIQKAGDYVLRLRAYGEQAGTELPKMAVRVAGKDVVVRSIKALEGAPETFEVPVTLEQGRVRFAVAYLNNFNADGDRNVFLNSFEIIGPLGGGEEEYPDSLRRLIPGPPARGGERAAARGSLKQFARRAWRRPVTDAEAERLVGFVGLVLQDGGSYPEAMRLALQAVLVSPHFLFRWELDPEKLEPGQSRELNDHELAARLSYFLWSSLPDDELFATADRGELTKPEGLEAQVRRMLKDWRIGAFVKNFGGQWLQTRNLDELEPDGAAFPGWNWELREAMKRETELFLETIIREDRPLQDLLDADFTFVNERLAKHYGLPGVTGNDFQRVKLAPESGRGGVLTLGSVLTITSVPTRTSPVLRGKWILEQILGTPPPPPPPNVGEIPEDGEAVKAASLRQRLEQHRNKPDCATCHQKMDPLGFALENFDGIGAWRDQDGGHPVDASAELPGGRQIAAPGDLKRVLRDHKDFPPALASKLMTYALGRGLEYYDRCAVDAVVADLKEKDQRFSALVLGIVKSDPFRLRQPEANAARHAALGANPVPAN